MLFTNILPPKYDSELISKSLPYTPAELEANKTLSEK